MDMLRAVELVKKVESLHVERGTVEEKLASLPKKVESIKHILQEEKQELDALEAEIATQKQACQKVSADISAIEVNHQEAKTRLSAITNQKEYQAALKEVEAVSVQSEQRKKQLTTEEERLQSLETALTEMKQSTAEHQNIFDVQRETAIKQRLEAMNTSYETLDSKISQILNELPVEYQKNVKILMQRKMVPFVGEASPDNVCSVCHLSYPPQLLMTAIKDQHMMQCPNCFRILYPV